MGKPSKKSLAKVEVAPVVAAPVKPGKKGKRDADEVVAKVANVKKQKLEVKTQVKKKKQESSDSDDTEESEEEQQVKVEGQKAVPPKVPAVESDGDDSEGSSSGGEEKAPEKTVPAAASQKKAESDESDSDDDSSEDEETVKAVKTALTSNGKVDSSEDDDESEDDESDDDDEKTPAAKADASKKETEASDDESSENESEEESDEEMPDAKSPKTVTKQAVKPSEKNVPKTPVTQATPQASGSKTLFMGNLPFRIEQEDIVTFFKEAGAEVYEVRIGMEEDGRSKGFGHVEFATSEDAHKALKLNGTNLWDRPVKLDLARQKGEYTPNTGKTFQKSGGDQTIFIRGFDNSLSEDEVRSSLVEHFSSCGEVSGTAIRLPMDRETNSLKGMAYITFNDADTFAKALELNGSEFGDGSLKIEEARPRSDSGGGGNWRGGSSGGRFNDRDGGRGRGRGRGRDFGGRGRGGRDGGRGRGRGGRDGGRGRGSPYGKPSMVGSGKKTRFDD